MTKITERGTRVRIVGILVALVAALVCIQTVSFAEDSGSTSSTGDAYVSAVKVAELIDGTEPFDSDDFAGDDSSDTNLIVRTFDYINYTLSYTTALTDATVTVDSGTLYAEFILPCSPSVAVFNMDGMNWMSDAVLTYTFTDGSTGTSYDDADDVVSQTLTGYRALSNASTTMLPGAGTLSVSVYVGSAQNSDIIQPTFTLWMEDNTDDQQVSAQPDEVVVSAALKMKVQIKQSSEMNIYGEYDLTTGGEDAAQDTISGAETVRGRMEEYGVTIILENDTVEKGLKGLEFPTGEITFDITLNEYSMNSSGALLSDQCGYTPVMWDYNENERNSWYGEWGRYFVKHNSYAYSAAPYNYIGCHSYSTAYDSCYDGGDWTIEQDASDPLLYHVTIKEYSIDVDNYVFPTADNTWYKRTTDGTTYKANQACISAGVIQCVLQFPYGDVDKITSVYYSVSADNYAVDGEGLDGSSKYAGTYTLLPLGSINVTSNFTTTEGTSRANHYLGSSYSAGDASEFAGNTVRAWATVTTTTDETVETKIGFLKWDADCFEIDRTSSYYSTTGLGRSTSGTSIGYYVGRTSNWSSVQEMSDTLMNDSSLYFYTSLDDLEAAGLVCVGVLYVNDLSVSGSNCINSYGIDLTIKDTATTGETYAIATDGWASYSNVNPMTQIDDTTEYTMDTDMILNYDLYIAYCSADVYSNMNKSRSTDAYYVKTEYDEDGNIISGTNLNGPYAGNSLLVLGEKTTLTISVADTSSDGSTKTVYDMDAGERTVNYSIQPYVEAEGSAAATGATTTTTITIKVTIPSDLTYDSGSAYYGDTAITPTVTTDSDGNTILTFALENVVVGSELDEITFSCTIGKAGTTEDVTNNQSILVYATSASTSDNRVKQAEFGNSASTSITVVILATTSVSKSVDMSFIERDGTFVWTLRVANTSNTDATETRLVDVFPQDGDSLGTSFAGDYTITSITIDFSDGTTSYASDADSMAFYVTTSADPGSGSDLVTNGVTGWTDLIRTSSVSDSVVTLDVSGYEDMTAIYYDLGTLASNESIAITFTVETDSNDPGDVYVNQFYEYGSNQADYVASNSVSVRVAQRTISGLAWLDANKDGIRNDDETLLPNVDVSLYRSTVSDYGTASEAVQVDGLTLYPAYDVYGDKVASVTTDSDGAYEFSNLESGEYYVVFSGNTIVYYGVTLYQEGYDSTVDSDTYAVLNSDGSAITAAHTDGIELPALEDMDRYLYESIHNDSGFTESSLTFTKKDSLTDEALDGAVFALQNSDGAYLTFDSNYVYTGTVSSLTEDCYLTTDDNGEITVTRIPAWTYTLVEIEAPYGYEASSDIVTVTIANPGDDAGDGIVVYNDRILGSITIIKYGTNDTPLSGVTFTVADENGDVVATGETDSSGSVTFSDLAVGTYEVTETGTVDGYALLTDSISATIPLTYTEEEAEAYGDIIDLDKGVLKDGVWYFYNVTYKISNGVSFDMPMTGADGSGNHMTILLLAGLASVCLAGLCCGFLGWRWEGRRQRKSV